MAMKYNATASVAINIPALKVDFDLGAATLTPKENGTNDTNFIIELPVGAIYINGTAKILTTDSTPVEVTNVTAAFDQDTRILTITALEASDLAINTNYNIVFEAEQTA